MLKLENKTITASFSAKGAELQSVYNKETQQEYLWEGDPTFWGKFSPILFPIVGGLKGNTYLFNDQKYELPRHGFARDLVFEVEKSSNHEITFLLKHDPYTLSVYPFEFELRLHYELTETGLRCSYRVYNPATEPLLFSIGGHPAFAIHVNADLKYEDYYLSFNRDEQLVYHKINQDLIDDETLTIPLQEGTLPLKHELFYEDALVFKSLKSNMIRIKNKNNNQGLDFSFDSFPFFGIWAARDANFVCLEPWCGIADGIHHDQQLTEKEGIISLSGDEHWSRSWEISAY